MSNVKIGHAAINELGLITGGKAGDQTGKEVCIADWYDKGWDVLLRPTNQNLAEKIASFIESVCKNDNIGYGQDDRYSFYLLVKSVNYNVAKIVKPVATDCSQLVATACIAAGLNVSPYSTTRGLRSELLSTGEFIAYTDSKYVRNSDYIKRGDILLAEGVHVATVLTDGAKVVTPVKITASVSGSHKVGEELTAKDFTVKVTMSDGTTKINPEYWSATQTKLTKESNVITVSYKSVSCKITVRATYRTHTVIKGESLWSIATKYLGSGHRYTDIKDLNGLKTTTLEIGQVLKLPV